ncbi:MAG: DUF523 domain-containing protein [Candidatus Abyssobacteria bacterium SURF_5]|uniref:DUF523 domain-containing protein n=1 Tax=Abyssobacteria bacterium (strain SURF_5) TaxID=2093360 RepID=A0A3A4P7D5_ABYX5|nr:MAG: DUF523 domain-containing protein [Candidatus Abyssubacteria bacterium SURF_5]
MAQIITDRIKIGISACNFGATVRWNHRGWDRPLLLGREKSDFIWTPVCPEVNAGLGVPRPPVRLSGGNGHEFWSGAAKMKNRAGEDVTTLVKEGYLKSLDTLRQAQVAAFVFMEGSPSCGVYRTTLRDRRLGQPPGAFGSLLLKDGYFLIPAIDLESPVKWWDWRRRLHSFVWLKHQEIDSKKHIYDIWHLLKFMCQEVAPKESAEIGRRLAAMPSKFSQPFADQWKSEVLMLLRKPSTHARIGSIMLKHYAHYRKHFNPAAGDIKSPRSDIAKHAFVRELREMEKRAYLEGYDFAGTPVLYRACSQSHHSLPPTS